MNLILALLITWTPLITDATENVGLDIKEVYYNISDENLNVKVEFSNFFKDEFTSCSTWIDTDRNRGTGVLINDIGADYYILVYYWMEDETLTTHADLYRYSEGWNFVQSLDVHDTQNGFWYSIPCDLLKSSEIYLVFKTWHMGEEDFAPNSGNVSISLPQLEVWNIYDSNDNGKIEDDELIDAIMDWLNGKLSDLELINVILKWLTS